MKLTNRNFFFFLAAVFIGFGLWYVIKPAIKTNNKPYVTDSKTITVIAGGDVSMAWKIGQKIAAGQTDYPFAKMGNTLKKADIAFVNLEGQLADLRGESQLPVSIYRFSGPPEGAQSLSDAGIDIVSVANNHMWDYGKKHLEETLNLLSAQNVRYVGANMDTEKVFQPVITEMKSKTIAWLAMTDFLNGYENAGASSYVAYQNETRLIEEIKKIKNRVDWVFVSFHGGAQYAEKPAEEKVKTARNFIDAGADAVISHHPHVPQKIETYKGKPIFYSLGNFAFWQPLSFWTQHSFLVEFKLTESHKVEYGIIPIKSGWQPEALTNKAEIQKLMTRLFP